MNQEELIEKVVKGEIKFYQVEKYTDIETATTIRRKAIEKIIGKELKHIGSYSIDMKQTASRNIEAPIGVQQIPLGIAGPLKVKGEVADGEYLIPLATTEGALVASVNRGCSIITASGGAKARVLKSAITRAPCILVPDTEHAVKLVNWVKDNFEKICEVFKGQDPFLKLLDFQPWIIGRNVFLRLLADTADAMGMNMVTSASEAVCNFIQENLPWAETIALSGNMCVDKKPTALNFILGRGKTVQSEAILKREYIKETLKTTAQKMVEVVYRKIYVGSGQAASYGFNSHVANIIAAIWIATGQDAAHIGESSMGIVTAEEINNGDLYVSLTLPSMICGTIGGGMWLSQMQEALSIMDCGGGFIKGKPPGTLAKKFAEIACSAALAGEVSLIAALAAGHLARAHEALGRGETARKKVEKLF
ncbi:MAG: hydroxymethylglutaryl-CoA reductase (NADPH) [Candidatus Freyarchaeota archaeon]|nr:hydroxymethylglutaryl-CoA reductase (NADPH) [Candidatus Jordarchaeia archaeon]MBS7267564.1 hydroxymethylglutaryl-CoA reductase (NADPH) [Candidatus Jordarchaeia archaeon]MBS7280039.1 hydroxymethylglutaryl-CoA reductase (NADPH) [Candidatus Jordarchaeia archaeon]